jgi:hypothetical protein
LETQPADGGDTVDEINPVLTQPRRIAELIFDRSVMRCGIDIVRRNGWIRPDQGDREIASFRPSARPQRIDGDVLNAEITSLDVDE